MERLVWLLLVWVGVSVSALADPCETARIALHLARLSTDATDRRENIPPLSALHQRLCDEEGPRKGTHRYSNGQLATASGATTAWSYPNGQVASYVPGNARIPWYYPNGRVMAQSPGNPNLPVYYPNGRILTTSRALATLPWYWDNGQVMSPSPANFHLPWSLANGTPYGSPPLVRVRERHLGLEDLAGLLEVLADWHEVELEE